MYLGLGLPPVTHASHWKMLSFSPFLAKVWAVINFLESPAHLLLTNHGGQGTLGSDWPRLDYVPVPELECVVTPTQTM